MAHSGFTQYSHHDFIKQLSQLLQDRYTWDGDGFTILKELVQNSNDAGATKLDFGWFSPAYDSHDAAEDTCQETIGKSAPHPLLTSPALFAVNNGPFANADALNITRLGSNSKAGEATTAGRFGLGLKSVFHLCEAFFYLAAPFDGPGDRLCRIFNPWSPPLGCDETGPYEHWDFDSNESVAEQIEMIIRERLSPVFSESQQYFCLWIPLRDPALLTSDTIVPGQLDESRLRSMLESENLRFKLAELLPFLHSLREIRVWVPDTNGSISEQFDVRLTAKSSALPRLPETANDEFPTSHQTKLAGQVEIHQHEGRSERCEYIGVESIAGGESLQQLWEHPKWPKDKSLDPETNRWREHRVKLIPHGAIRLMASPPHGRRARLSFHWCVFLPLGSVTGHEHIEIEAPLTADVSVFLHGYFFVDSGRKRHLKNAGHAGQFADLDTEHLQQEWNSEIEAQAVWPYLLEALADFVAQLQWDDQQIDELTQAFCELLRQLNDGPRNVFNAVSARKQWLYVLIATSNGQVGGEWMLKPSGAVVYDIPPLVRHVPIDAMLPGITAPGSKRLVTVKGKPRISATAISPWSPTLLQRLIASLDPVVAFAKEENLRYLSDLLEHCACSVEQQQAVGDAIWPVFKRAFASDFCNLAVLENLASPLQDILENVPEKHRLNLNWATASRKGVAETFRLVAKMSGDVLPIPACAVSSGKDCRQLNSDMVVKILKGISRLSLEKDLLADVVGDLLDRANLNRDALSGRLANFPILVVFNYRVEQDQRVEWQDFRKRRRLVFCDIAGLTRQLQNAIGQAGELWQIDPAFAKKVLGREHNLPGCSWRECAAVLSPSPDGRLSHLTGPVLGEWQNRRPLLETLAVNLGTGSADDSERLTSACRVMLHGRIQDANFNPALFLAADGEFETLAEKLVRHILGCRLDPKTRQNEEWRIITGDPATWAMTKLNLEQREILDLVPLKLMEPTVLQSLERARSEQLIGFDVNDDEYGILLETLGESHPDLLKRLPVHPTIGGKRIAITSENEDSTYWDNGYQLDNDLQHSTVLLRMHKDHRLRSLQEGLTDPLGPQQVIDIVLKTPSPDRYWKAIVKAISETSDPLPADTLTDLKTVCWFPTQYGARCRADLICFTLHDRQIETPLPEGFQSDVNRLSEKCKGAFIPDWQLDKNLLKQLTRSGNVVCQRLREWDVLPDTTESLQQLSLLLSLRHDNSIGLIPRDHLENWLAIEWDADLMPAYRILKTVEGRFDADLCFSHASSEVRRPVEDLDRLIGILQVLTSEHERARTENHRKQTLQIFLKYFDFLLIHKECSDVSQLRPLRLLSQAGTWRPCSEMCRHASGIAREHVLADEIAELLNSRGFVSPDAKNLSNQRYDSEDGDRSSEEADGYVEDAVTVVERYFRAWEGYLTNDVIGGFIALLGGGRRMENLANRYLGKRSLDETRRNLHITSTGIGTRSLRISDQRVHPAIISEQSTTAVNILDESFNVPLASTCECLLVGFGTGQHVEVTMGARKRFIDIQLRAFDPSVIDCDAQELTRLLAEAGRVLLVEGYGLSEDSTLHQVVHGTFQDLQESDQLEIRVTQQFILEDSELLLSQLGLQSDSLFGPVLTDLTKFKRLRAERAHNERRFDRKASWTDREVDEEHDTPNHRLRRLLEEDTEGQQRVLTAVRRRIQGHNQYNAATIPFELFQNADDACVERQQLLNGTIDCDTITYFVRDDFLVVRHFGRCINQVPRGSDPRTHRLSDDLRKMLTPWLSSKDSTDQDSSQLQLTGKFGLGFKSIFLVSDRPRLLSGRISCELVGGVFPRYVDIEERTEFDRYCESLVPEAKREVTVIEIPLSNVAGEGISNDEDVESMPRVAPIIDRFQQLAHLLVIFARQIRIIEIRSDFDGKIYSTEWRDTPVSGVPHCFNGTLKPLPEFSGTGSADRGLGPGGPARRALVLRTSKYDGALLLVHNGRCFEKLPDEVPTLWVTAPTGETLEVGFALNASFSLDPGRAQLGRESPENDEIAADIGRELGQRFVSLFKHQQEVGWCQFCKDVDLDGGADEYSFWNSLWDLIGTSLADLADTSDAGRILRLVFWGPQGAAAALYRECPVLPTRLKGASFRNILTTIPQVNLSVSGILANDDGYSLMCVRDWPTFTKRLAGGRVISDRLIATPLRQLLVDPGSGIQQGYELANLLNWEIPDQRVGSEDADHFGTIFAGDVLKDCNRDEENRLLKTLHLLHFKNKSGDFQPAAKLLIGHQPQGAPSDNRRDDERMRAAFAPKDCVLNGKYNAAGVAFFELCRERLDAPATKLAVWVFNASDEDSRNAARVYLADGELGRSVQSEIKLSGGIRGTWLEDMTRSAEFKAMAPAQQGQLVGLLSEEQASQKVKDIISQIQCPVIFTHAAPNNVLKQIQKWWSKESSRYLREYEQRTYPDGELRNLARAGNDPNDQFRKDWVILFLLGLTHTMGRTVAMQHREFLRKCDDEGWLDMIASSERQPENWMQWIDNFLDRQIDDSRFLQWMKQFVGIYQVSQHLDVYIGAFESVEQSERQFALTDIANPRSSPRFQGGGFDAPPLSRVLGMGQCFVLRELVRKRIVTNAKAHRHCYVPVKRTRDLLTSLGCEGLDRPARKWELSCEIHRFLCDHLGLEGAHFGLTFDIPLQIIAEQEELQDKFFHHAIAFHDDEDDLWSLPEELIQDDMSSQNL